MTNALLTRNLTPTAVFIRTAEGRLPHGEQLERGMLMHYVTADTPVVLYHLSNVASGP